MLPYCWRYLISTKLRIGELCLNAGACREVILVQPLVHTSLIGAVRMSATQYDTA